MLLHLRNRLNIHKWLRLFNSRKAALLLQKTTWTVATAEPLFCNIIQPISNN